MITIVSYGVCYYKKLNIDLHSDMKLVLIRNFSFLAQGFASAWVQFYLPLGVTHTISATGPIYVAIFQYIF